MVFWRCSTDLISHSAEQTWRLGTRLGGLLQAGDVVCLAGDLGAGKTAFAIGVGEGWGVTTPGKKTLLVHSPQGAWRVEGLIADLREAPDNLPLEQFDAVLHFDKTRAVEPLERTSEWEAGEVPETFPTAL